MEHLTADELHALLAHLVKNSLPRTTSFKEQARRILEVAAALKARADVEHAK